MVIIANETNVLAVLKGYSLDKVLPCVADYENIRVIVKIGKDLSDLLPYIKGYLKKGIYLKEVPFLSFKREGKNIILYRDSIAMTKLADEQEVVEELKYLSTVIQEVINNKETIEPDYSYGRNMSPILLYKFTPKTNCGQCGEATCLAFVTKLVNDKKTIAQCRPLFTLSYKQERSGMFEVLTEYGFDLPESMA